MTNDPAILLYDGTCGFCDGAVQFVLKVDRRGEMRFAALDSDFGAAVLQRHPELATVDSVVYVERPGTADERVTVRSEAALRVADYLGGPWRALGTVVRLVPASIRDGLYDRFAAIRYRVFGRIDSCALPAPEVRARFIA
ncbi:DCC1-like thiol-disulfide oxidoreductase family protein [Mycobacterium sp. NPDC006124]|uniref:thiol-disulfide oxidoreductase DCC family protein n=1 Tax=Mycobacterium sp. NPDC006124 TaxID=3156729 RepID=UPI0033BAFC05